MNEQMRKEVKVFKALQNVTYNELAEFLEIKTNSFYNWLHGQYDLSPQKIERLKEILQDLGE